MNVLAIIPARSGSKGIKDKNIKMLGNDHLINYTIKAALNSKLISDVVVSTDSKKIQEIALKSGAQVPFIRPKSLAEDSTPSYPVVIHATELMQKKLRKSYEIIVMLQPTTPFRTAIHIDEALNKLIDSQYTSVVSVVKVGGYHPLRMKRIVNDSLINYVDNGYEDMRPRQELPSVYIRNGGIYGGFTQEIIKYKSLVTQECLAYEMGERESINIDSILDFVSAEYFITRK